MPSTPTAPAVAEPRDAASLLMLHAGAAPGVLMGMRGARHRFMPNRLVFPGGAVDPADFAAQHATPLTEPARTGLLRAADPALAVAIAHAAARELTEETALSLGTPPALDGLHYLCRAVTPPTEPVRFNARFLVVSADRVTGTLGGSGELEGLRVYGVAEALALDLAWVTRKVLENLQHWLDLAPAERAARDRFPLCVEMVWGWE